VTFLATITQEAATTAAIKRGMMLAQLLQRIGRGGRSFLVLTVFVSSLALLALSTSAGASTDSSKATLGPVGSRSANALKAETSEQKRRKKRKLPGLGLLPSKSHITPIKPAAGANGVTLPNSVDLRKWAVPIGNQGSVGSCVTWAIDYAMLGWYANHDGKAGQPFNPMYSYSQAHVNNTDTGGGSYPANVVVNGAVVYRGVMNIAQTQGNDTMAHYHTQNTTDFISKPNASDVANAAHFKISQFHALFDSSSPGGTAGQAMIQTELANGRPVAIGMTVFSSFQTPMYNKTSLASATYDEATGSYKGGHEVLAVGYDETGLLIQNSWGKPWGYGGYARLTWRVVDRLVSSAYVIDGFATDTGTNTTDKIPPTMGAVDQQFPLNQPITSTTAPVTFSWSASDRSGIAQYAVYVKTDGGRYVYQSAIGATATQNTFSLSIGHSYQVAVAAKDGAGNWSGYSYSAKVTPTFFDDTGFTVSSAWARYSSSDTFGGTYIGTTDAGAWVRKIFTGTDIALIGVKASNAGRATISCDGSSNTVGDFNSASIVTREIVAYCSFPQSGQHTMQVVNEGTSGRPSLFVDAFAILQ
jgi:C1A family cysteine protease